SHRPDDAKPHCAGTSQAPQKLSEYGLVDRAQQLCATGGLFNFGELTARRSDRLHSRICFCRSSLSATTLFWSFSGKRPQAGTKQKYRGSPARKSFETSVGGLLCLLDLYRSPGANSGNYFFVHPIFESFVSSRDIPCCYFRFRNSLSPPDLFS